MGAQRARSENHENLNCATSTGPIKLRLKREACLYKDFNCGSSKVPVLDSLY